MIHGSQRLEMLISEVYFSSTGLYLKWDTSDFSKLVESKLTDCRVPQPSYLLFQFTWTEQIMPGNLNTEMWKIDKCIWNVNLATASSPSSLYLLDWPFALLNVPFKLKFGGGDAEKIAQSVKSSLYRREDLSLDPQTQY